MPDKIFWPFWLQFLKHAVTFVLVAGAGIHAYYKHVQEAVSPVSRRKWMFWIYAVVFMAAGAAVFAQLCIVSTFRESTGDSSFTSDRAYTDLAFVFRVSDGCKAEELRGCYLGEDFLNAASNRQETQAPVLSGFECSECGTEIPKRASFEEAEESALNRTSQKADSSLRSE